MNHGDIAKELTENSIRIEKIIYLAGSCMDYSFPSDIQDAFEEQPEEMFQAMGLEWDDELDGPEYISEHLIQHGKLGFLVLFATPVPISFNKDGDGYSTGGWGFYQLNWLYGDTIEELIEPAKKWQADMIEKKRKEAA